MGSNDSDTFLDLLHIMHRLRKSCPWDQKQTHASLAKYCIEEAFEVVDAIEKQDPRELKGELGDLLLQVIFHAELASEKEEFNVFDVITTLCEKLIRRHPHVFEENHQNIQDSKDVMEQWDQIKEKEAQSKSSASNSIFSSIPKSLPALMQAEKIGAKSSSKAGFDWQTPNEVLQKVKEEISEYEDAQSYEQKEEELGDCLFAMANLCRHEGIDPEMALRKANQKFQRRFDSMQTFAKEEGRTMNQLSPKELESLWNRVKKLNQNT